MSNFNSLDYLGVVGIYGLRVGGFLRIMPPCGSILQAGTMEPSAATIIIFGFFRGVSTPPLNFRRGDTEAPI